MDSDSDGFAPASAQQPAANLDASMGGVAPTAPLARVLASRAMEEQLGSLRRLLPVGVSLALCQPLQSGADALPPIGAVLLPLAVFGEHAGNLVLTGCPEAAAEPWSRLLVRAIETFVEGRLMQRRVTAETLDAYRELVGLQRAALAFGKSMRPIEVAEALLGELAQGARLPSAALVLLGGDSGAADLTVLAETGMDLLHLPALDLSRLRSAPGFAAILKHGRGEIVNAPDQTNGWCGALPGAGAVLVVPFVAEDEVLGALVRLRPAEGEGFAAADLAHAVTLASMAAVGLHNARLFEQVLEVKRYNETVLQSLSSGVVSLDAAGAIVTANAAALKMLGATGEGIVGAAAESVWRGANAWVLEDAATAIRGIEPNASVDRQLQAADGTVTSVNLVAHPLPGAPGSAQGAVLLFENITPEKRLKGTMARFVSSSVVDRLLEAGEVILGGELQEASILFADIRGFTRLAEGLAARLLVATLNEHFSAMVDAVFDHGGTLDKFVGDGLMAVFGAPFPGRDDPDQALAAAVDMVRRARSANARRRQECLAELELCVGINTGEVVAGTIGSPRRMDYTVIGDHVNLAARIEKANRYFGTRILISDHTAARLSRRWTLRELDRVRVSGRNQPVRLLEVLDHHDAVSFPHMAAACAAFAEGLAAYRRQDWRKGALCFAEALRANPDDRPTQIFLHRCWTHLATPPEPGWTDISEMGAIAG